IAEKHWDKNFGLALAVWDRMFGTLVVPEPDEDFVFGLTDNEHDEYQSLYRLHVLPVQKMGRHLRRMLERRQKLRPERHAGEIA
ncbi:MAG: sterol desaturase family protein, partial [Rhodopila sp.]